MAADSPDHIAAAIQHLRDAFGLDDDGWVIEVRPGQATLTREHGRALDQVRPSSAGPASAPGLPPAELPPH